jgi:hypothetical protein
MESWIDSRYGKEIILALTTPRAQVGPLNFLRVWSDRGLKFNTYFCLVTGDVLRYTATVPDELPIDVEMACGNSSAAS